MKKLFFVSSVILVCMSCGQNDTTPVKSNFPVQLVTLDPGHFHAALVQKTMYKDVDSVVHVYAPDGNDLQLHIQRVDAFNTRKDDPTHWKEDIYTSDDFFETMLSEKKGNVVVLAGNNRKKTEYILRSLQNGFNVMADKPMAVTTEGFDMLKKAFEVAKQNNLVLYDIMTERFEITSILQRELAMLPELFGTLEKGTITNPAVVNESIHGLYKIVSGNALTRPAWFMDASQQGQGITDVTTHLVDLIQWGCFPEQSLDYTKDIVVDSARKWPTDLTLSQFKSITKLDEFPDYLRDNVKDSILHVYSNGAISYQVKGVHAQVSVQWDYQVTGGADRHYSLMRGSKSNLVIRQGEQEGYKQTLFIEPATNNAAFEKTVVEQIKSIQAKYPGVELKKSPKGWEIIIPENYKEGHEAHFARVTQNYLEYLSKHNMPAWEVPNMLAKYYTTTKALEIALKNKK
jgi:predicted dehydrogenase